MTVSPLTPQQLASRIAADPELVLLDVRPAAERVMAAIPGAVCIPATQLAGRLHELDPDLPTVVFCHFGVRSMAAAALLVDRDFEEVFSLTGGIDLYARDIAPEIPRY